MDDWHGNVPITEQSCSRSEVLVGPERRRRWSLAEKRRIVAESLAPGAVSSVVARRHGIHPNQLCDWRRTLGRLAAETIPDFVPISVAATPSEASHPKHRCRGHAPARCRATRSKSSWAWRRCVFRPFDELTLRRVLAVVKSLG
jgi:transposase-like protein